MTTSTPARDPLFVTAWAAAFVLGLRLSYTIAPPIADRLAQWLAPAARSVTWEGGNQEQHTSYTATFVLCGLLVALVVLAWLRLDRALERAAGRRWLRLGLVLVTLGAAATLGWQAVVAACGCMAIALPFGQPEASTSSHQRERSGPLVVIATLASLVYFCWISLAPRGSSTWQWLALATGVTALTGALVRWRRRSESDEAPYETSVIVAPLWVLPLLGVLRGPSPLWLLPAILLSALLSVRAELRRHLSPAARWLRGVAAPLVLVWILVLPLAFRELPSANWDKHEGFHAAWINSATFGGVFMADTALVYGPLREYTLYGFLKLTSLTFANLRVAHLLVNLCGAAILLSVSWRLVRGKMLAQSWFAYTLIAHTALRCFVGYRSHTCFGWADIARPAIAIAALASLTFALTQSRRARWQLVSIGALQGISVFYSQEYGLAALLAGVVAIALDVLLRESGAPLRARAGAAATRLALWLAGLAASVSIVLVAYASVGKLSAMLRSLFSMMMLIGTGQIGNLSSHKPLTLESLGQPGQLVQKLPELLRSYPPYPEYAGLEWALPPLVYFLTLAVLTITLCRRAWSRRSTVMLALVLFGAATYRITMSRPDVYHLLSGTPAALLLTAMLVADGSSTFTTSHGSWRWITGGGLALVLLSGIVLGEATTGVRLRTHLIASGKERPSGLTPHQNADIPRAGDMLIPEPTHSLIVYLREQSAPTEPLFVRFDVLDGAEIYFLAERRNPTRYDTIQEMTLPWMQKEAFKAMRDAPPKLIVGTNESFLGPELSDYVRKGWRRDRAFGRYVVSTRASSP